jgi:hypothetical protein
MAFPLLSLFYAVAEGLTAVTTIVGPAAIQEALKDKEKEKKDKKKDKRF